MRFTHGVTPRDLLTVSTTTDPVPHMHQAEQIWGCPVYSQSADCQIDETTIFSSGCSGDWARVSWPPLRNFWIHYWYYHGTYQVNSRQIQFKLFLADLVFLSPLPGYWLCSMQMAYNVEDFQASPIKSHYFQLIMILRMLHWSCSLFFLRNSLSRTSVLSPPPIPCYQLLKEEGLIAVMFCIWHLLRQW